MLKSKHAKLFYTAFLSIKYYDYSDILLTCVRVNIPGWTWAVRVSSTEHVLPCNILFGPLPILLS